MAAADLAFGRHLVDGAKNSREPDLIKKPKYGGGGNDCADELDEKKALEGGLGEGGNSAEGDGLPGEGRFGLLSVRPRWCNSGFGGSRFDERGFRFRNQVVFVGGVWGACGCCCGGARMTGMG